MYGLMTYAIKRSAEPFKNFL